MPDPSATALAIRLADIPWIALYAAPYVCLLACGWRRIASLQRPARRLLACLAGAALAGGVIWALAIHGNPWARQALFYHKDDESYDRWGRRIAERWRQGERPPLSRDFEIGSLHTGYYRFVAGIYYVAGPSPRLLIFLNLLAGAALPVALYLLTLDFAGAEAARRAAWLGALYPTFWYDSAFLLRDTWITLFFLAALAVYFDLEARTESARGWAVFRWVCLAAVGFQLFLLRYYLVAVLGLGILLYELTKGKRRMAVSAAALGMLALAFAARMIPSVALFEDQFAPRVGHLQDRMIQSFTWAIPRDLASFRPVAERFAEGLFKLFAAPFPWATKGGYVVEYFLWPGQWMLLLFLLPFGLWGMVRAARTDQRQAFLLLFPFIAGAYGFAVAYGGAVPRQRMFLDALLIVFAGWAWALRREGGGPGRRWLIVYYSLSGLFFVLHVASLFWRGIW